MRTVCVLAASVVAIGLTIGPASAEPTTCIRELPSKRSEHWSYRLVSGQRCWYPDSARATIPRKFELGRKALSRTGQVQRSAEPSPSSKPSIFRLTSTQNDLRGSSFIAGPWNERITPDAESSRPPPVAVDSGLRTPASFADIWNDRAAPGGIVERPIGIGTGNLRSAVPTKVDDSAPRIARQQTTSPSSPRDNNLLWLVLWFGLGVGFGAAAVLGPKASKMSRRQCGLSLLKFIGWQRNHGVSAFVERMAQHTSWLGHAAGSLFGGRARVVVSLENCARQVRVLAAAAVPHTLLRDLARYAREAPANGSYLANTHAWRLQRPGGIVPLLRMITHARLQRLPSWPLNSARPTVTVRPSGSGTAATISSTTASSSRFAARYVSTSRSISRIRG
jgi:hypothetical protein